MLKYVSLILPLFLFGCGPADSAIKDDESSYFGPHAQEYRFHLKAEILMPVSQGEPTSQSIQTDVRLAAKYALGRMHKDGSMYPDMTSRMLKFKVDAKNPDYYNVAYSLTSKAVLARNLKDYVFYLPTQPRKIYKQAGEIGKCHHKDDDLVDEGNFWYQWDPEISGCALKENRDYTKAKATLTPLLVPAKTYPEFQRLLQNGVVNTTIFFGAASKKNEDWNPSTSNDLGAISFRQMELFLISELGFTFKPYSENEIRKIYNPKNANFLPQGKIGTMKGSHGIIKVRMLFVDSHFGATRAQAFQYFWRNALKNDSFILYEGHSGIGSNLQLNNIEKEQGFKIEMNKNYQIIFFGSCLPYAYYSQMYFDRKITAADPKGTKNLDIITYAKEAHFGNKESHQAMRIIGSAIRMGLQFSFQDMVLPMAQDFFGVIGDEDNPTESKYF